MADMEENKTIDQPSVPEYSALYSAVVYRNWEIARNLLTNHEHKFQLTEFTSSRRGETALHNACWWGGPLHIVESYNEVNPSVLMRLDNKLRSPLRYASGYASKEVVEFLIDAAPMAARLLDVDGLLPLHVAIKNKRAPSIIQSLLNVYPEAIHHASHCVGGRNSNGCDDYDESDRRTPLELLYMKWNDDLSANIGNLENLTEGMDCDGLTTLRDSLHFLLKAFVSTSIAARDEVNSQSNDDLAQKNFQCPLHQILKLSDEVLPPIFKEFLVRTSCDQALHEKDDKGNLPLHIAATQNAPETNLIPVLLERYPKASLIANKDGKLPLALAVESGKSWQKGGINEMVKCAPQTLSIRDVHTNLYPFMLAAAVVVSPEDSYKNEEEKEKEHEEDRSVTVTYELLRRFPELIQRST